jgi:hypothetical protein
MIKLNSFLKRLIMHGTLLKERKQFVLNRFGDESIQFFKKNFELQLDRRFFE